MARSAGAFRITSWDEQDYAGEKDGSRMSEANVTQEFDGDIEGTGSVRWLMCYRADGTADYVGLQHIVGRVGGRAGSFVLRSMGAFDGSKAAGDWSVVQGSGTGELEALTGTGRIDAPMGAQATYILDYEV